MARITIDCSNSYALELTRKIYTIFKENPPKVVGKAYSDKELLECIFLEQRTAKEYNETIKKKQQLALAFYKKLQKIVIEQVRTANNHPKTQKPDAPYEQAFFQDQRYTSQRVQNCSTALDILQKTSSFLWLGSFYILNPVFDEPETFELVFDKNMVSGIHKAIEEALNNKNEVEFFEIQPFIPKAYPFYQKALLGITIVASMGAFLALNEIVKGCQEDTCKGILTLTLSLCMGGLASCMAWVSFALLTGITIATFGVALGVYAAGALGCLLGAYVIKKSFNPDDQPPKESVSKFIQSISSTQAEEEIKIRKQQKNDLGYTFFWTPANKEAMKLQREINYLRNSPAL